MAVEIICGGCRAKLKVKQELSGKPVRCPKCGDAVTVPGNQADDVFLDDGLGGDSEDEFEKVDEFPARTPLRRSKTSVRESKRKKSKATFPVRGLVIGIGLLIGMTVIIAVGFGVVAGVKIVLEKREIPAFFNAVMASQRRAGADIKKASELLSECIKNDCLDYTAVEQALARADATRVEVEAELAAITIPASGLKAQELVTSVRDWIKTEDQVLKSFVPDVIRVMKDRTRPLQARAVDVVALGIKVKAMEDPANLRMFQMQHDFLVANHIPVPPQILADLAKARSPRQLNPLPAFPMQNAAPAMPGIGARPPGLPPNMPPGGTGMPPVGTGTGPGPHGNGPGGPRFGPGRRGPRS